MIEAASVPRVLYAAENPRESVISGLSQAGYSVEVARNGLLALDAAVRTLPDLLVLELELPGLAGLELARVLRGMTTMPRLPLVLVASSYEELMDEGRLALVDDAWVAPATALEVEVRCQHLAARQAGLAQLFDEREGFRAMAHQDPLTGLPNRRQLDAELASTLTLTRACELPFSVLLFDVDRFKVINDVWGHPVGDRVLVEIARVFKRSSRRNDVFGRWGGEEFLYLLPGHQIQEALRQAERVRSELAAHPFRVPGEAISLTVSVGATEVNAIDTPETVMKRVDQLLYEAKRTGRNRVVSLAG